MSADTQIALGLAASVAYGLIRPLPSHRADALRRFRRNANRWLVERVYPMEERWK